MMNSRCFEILSPFHRVSARRAHTVPYVCCFIWQLLLLVDFMGAPNECANSIAVELQFKWRSAVDSSRGSARHKGKDEGRVKGRQAEVAKRGGRQQLLRHFWPLETVRILGLEMINCACRLAFRRGFFGGQMI